MKRFPYAALTLAVAMACGGARAVDPAVGVSVAGQRVDNARVDGKAMPPSSERELGVVYPLPSGVSHDEVLEMRTAIQTLPQTPEVERRSYDDAMTGALFVSGKADLTDAALQSLDALIEKLRGKEGLRISVVGHTDNQRLSVRTRKIFRDNQGLSEARALNVATYLRNGLGLAAGEVAIAGRGESEPIADNGNADGMARNRRVELRIWYEEQYVRPAAPATAAAPEAVVDTSRRVRRDCAGAAQTPYATPFRITVDGEPLEAAMPAEEADAQRCVDVALERADIQLRYDPLATAPMLNAWAAPDAVVKGESVAFRAWSNYVAWIRRAELRLFRTGQKSQETPLAVLPMGWTESTPWRVPADYPDEQVHYLLRVYDEQGHFDETSLKPLSLMAHARPINDADRPEREALTGFGENSLSLRNIPVRGGTVTISGDKIRADQRVEALGMPWPVDANGRFATKQILPAGPQSVEIRVIDADGMATSFRRNLSIPVDDWFYVVVGDLTLGQNRVSGPAQLVTGDTQHYDEKVYIDGRGAFYLKGKIKGEWLLTASADTAEQPIDELFTNFNSKDPRYLLRNINPDLYYPVYGDDSTTVDDAPTQGKFYVRLERGDSNVMWGNFKTAWSGSELTQFSRGLYGANLRLRSEEATRWGEKRSQLDAFAADPGTLPSREEFRGTGGSLYYLRHQDLTQGSERLWVEVRDRDSGLVLERKPLAAAQDYEINYLQGRVTLRDSLASVGSASGLILSSAYSGNPQYLVVTYEYAPGLTAVSSFAGGLRASQWLGDHLQVGVTSYRQGETTDSQTLLGADITLRKTPNTYMKLEGAHSSGTGSATLSTPNGGFSFNSTQSPGGRADAQRIELAADFADFSEDAKGRISAYAQHKEHGYSAPGQLSSNGEAVRQQGTKLEWQLLEATRLDLKADVRDGETQDAHAVELAVRQSLDSQWAVSVAAKRDERDNHVANASPLLSQNGARTDVQVRADYAPDRAGSTAGEKEDWGVFGFVQGTVERDGDRSANNRVGAGGSWQLNDRLRLNAEASGGSLGPGGKLGGNWRISDRSNAYLNYVVESENPDNAFRGRQGTWVSGSDYRVSDNVRLFGEVKSTSGAGPQSLSQAFGTDWAPNDRWTLGFKTEVGRLSDPLAGDVQRTAGGVTLAYKNGAFKYAGGMELRSEETTVNGQAGASHRNTWLMRNAASYQLDKAWRLMGKLNWSESSNSQGAFYDGSYHEVVMAAAYRPVDNDRWNTLFKYTNFYNVPTAGQVTANGSQADYAQRSQVLAVDTIYDVVPWMSVGAKYAMRFGELKASKSDSDWYSSRADLLVLRADWHFVREWDALLEWRTLRAKEAQDARAGALVGIYRHVAQGVKVGVGYNFTRYSDDLTDLSYRSRGWFLNVLATW